MATGRKAVIDIGTNSVLLTVAQLDPDGRMRVLVDEAVVTRLGEGLEGLGRLGASAICRTLEAVDEFVDKARALNVARVIAIGTSALRTASNAGAFVGRLPSGVDAYELLSETDEAKLGYIAAAMDEPQGVTAPLTVVDIGGGSVEVSQGLGRRFRSAESVPLGAIRLTESSLNGDPPGASQRIAALARADDLLLGITPPARPGKVVGIGGTLVSLLSVRLRLATYDARRLDGGRLTYEEISELAEFFCSRTEAERTQVVGLDPARAAIAPAGAIIAERVCQRLKVEELAVCTRGVRHGVLAEALAISPTASLGRDASDADNRMDS